jgi:two-component system phosphate regulon sensor histidine kinase PhoR
MRKKIIGSYVLLILMLTAVFWWIVNSSLVDAMLLQYEQHFVNEAKLVKMEFQERYSDTFDYGTFANDIHDLVDARITIINSEGVVLADSNEDPSVMNNHLTREEIQEALATGEAAVSVRYSDTLKADFMYAAVTAEVDGQTFILRVSKPLTAMRELTMRLQNYTWLSTAIAAILATLMAVLITRRITEPIYALTDAANQIAHGDFGRRIYNGSNDQIGDLTNSFNKMSIQLERSMRELKSRNVELESILNSMINGIIAIDQDRRILMINKICFEILNIPEDYVVQNESMYKIIRNEEVAEMVDTSIAKGISQIKELQYVHLDKILRVYINPIVTASEETLGSIVVFQDVTQIRKLEKMRSDFVSNVSHELKTPLTSIKGFVDTLKNGAIKDRDTAMRFLDIIDIESDRLYRLINDILLLSEIESMDREREAGDIILNEVIDEVINMLELKASEKGIVLKKTEHGIFRMNANRDRMKQMLINLVDNAIKYTERGEVEVTIEASDPWIRLLVRDTGIGFAEEHKDRLFERFYRVDKGRSRSLGGTGLGLSIVKHIVLLYKGRISVSSVPGEGSTFEILFPNQETLKSLNIEQS